MGAMANPIFLAVHRRLEEQRVANRVRANAEHYRKEYSAPVRQLEYVPRSCSQPCIHRNKTPSRSQNTRVDIPITLRCTPLEHGDLVVTGFNLGGAEVGCFQETREQPVLMKEFRCLTERWN